MEASRAVLVTGASTGIGRRITERLAASGYFVYAGVRKSGDIKALGGIGNVEPIRLDVTNPNDIAAALVTVTDAKRGLYGLVNNAGIATVDSLVTGNEAEFELVMSVNVHGVYRVTKSFAPLIIANKGRIVMIGSISGILADANIGAYSMSKHAIEAFTDSLAAELLPSGVGVSVIEPGNLNTNIARNAIERRGTDGGFPDLSKCPEPGVVADAVMLALTEPEPRRRYLVVSTEVEARVTIKKQISQLVQLNEGHRYSYSRSALLEMLDCALTNARSTTKGTSGA